MYGVIGLGFLANKWQIVTRAGYEGIHTFVVVLCIPAVIFRVLAKTDLYAPYVPFVFEYALRSHLGFNPEYAAVLSLRGPPALRAEKGDGGVSSAPSCPATIHVTPQPVLRHYRLSPPDL